MAFSLKRITILAACAALLGTANLAQAAPGHDHQRPAATQNWRGSAGNHRPNRPAAAQRPNRPHRPAAQHRSQRPAAQHHYRAPQRAYYRGGHVPNGWRHGNRRVINNWHSYRNLHQPPRGYQWVRGNNGDVLLVAIATGVIATIVANAVIN